MDAFLAVPSRRGHFRLESGYHADVWLTLDGLFTEPARIAPAVDALAARLRQYQISGICGPFVGGALLAQLLAVALNLRFYYAEPAPVADSGELFAAEYRFPLALRRGVAGERLAVVDDMISAGSSVRATIAAAHAAGASVHVVGGFVALGDVGASYFERRGMPLEVLERRSFTMWTREECPLCAADVPIETP